MRTSWKFLSLKNIIESLIDVIETNHNLKFSSFFYLAVYFVYTCQSLRHFKLF